MESHAAEGVHTSATSLSQGIPSRPPEAHQQSFTTRPHATTAQHLGPNNQTTLT